MAIVVLPVDVVRDRTADGGVASARAHRGDETARQEVSQQIVERHPGLAHDLAAVGVEGQDAVQARGQDHPPAAVERGVAVAAAAGMADEAVVIAGVPQGVDEGFAAVRGAGERRGPGQAPEAAEIYGLPIHSEGTWYQIESQMMASAEAPIHQLIRSRRAKTTGSSCSHPRWAKIHTRPIQ